MARPRIDPVSRSINARLAPPANLTTLQMKLWHREFDCFPPGYFTPADQRAMCFYLDWLAQYDAAKDRAAKEARSRSGVSRQTHAELIESSKVLIRLMTSLRMFPSTRAARSVFGNLASNPAIQTVPGDPKEPEWQRIMRQAQASMDSGPE